MTSYEEGVNYFDDTVEAVYANGWSVEYRNSFKVLTIDTDPTPDAEVLETIVLALCGTPIPELTEDLAGAQVVEVPIDRIWLSDGAVSGAVETLGAVDRVVGITGSGGSPSITGLPELTAAFEAGDFISADYEAVEPVVASQPELFMNYGDPEELQRFRDLGIPSIHYDPFAESPLGSAEQLKFMSLLFNDEATANKIFDEIASNYESLVERAATETAPTVLIGQLREGEFTTRSSSRIESVLVNDANAVNILSQGELADQLIDFEPIDLESVIAAAADADFWFMMNFRPAAETAVDFIAEEPLREEFTALGAGNAFHRFGGQGDYFSFGAVFVDELLADIVSIVHPELLPDRELRFLKRVPVE